MSPFTQVAIAACIDGNTMTVAIRIDKQIKPPTQHQITGGVVGAARILLGPKAAHRHDDPQVFLAHGAIAPRMMSTILEAHKGERLLPCRDEVVDGTAEAQAATRYTSRWSELFHTLREQIERDEITLATEYATEVREFKLEMSDGRVHYPFAEDVAEELGRFPASAVVAVLAAQCVPFRRGAKPKREYDPMAQLEKQRGHDPYAEIK